MIDKEQLQIMNDLMNKVDDDVSGAIIRNMQLVAPALMTPLGHRAVLSALSCNAIVFDAANGDQDKSPTRESMALAALLALHHILDSEDVWTAAIADLKKYFPDAKVPECEIIDRRSKKEAA